MYTCLVAKFKEDVSWTSKLNCKVIVANKDPEDNSYELNYENKGRETETFTRWIIDNYDNLNPEDTMIFLQGDPFGHISEEDFFKHVPVDGKPEITSHLPLPISGRWSYCHNKKCLIGYPDGGTIDLVIRPDPLIPWNQTLDLAKYIGLPPIKYVVSHAGGQWAVPNKYILNKSKNWWENLLSTHYVSDPLQAHVAGYCIERLWEIIWLHSDLEK